MVLDKFEQFWAVNRKLMEVSPEQEYFKHIPFRCYIDDGYKQKLIKPVTEDGHRKTLQDLINEMFPGKTGIYLLLMLNLFNFLSAVVIKTHGMIPPLETPLQWMSEHLSYPDNFLHLCVQT